MRLFTIISLLFIGAFVASCKKEYISYPYNTIEKFVVTDNTKMAFEASITTDNKIVVYWPPQQAVPDSITPVIIVSDRATISPASGKKVPFKETTVYTVTAQDGSVKKFTLMPSINQPLVYFNVGNNGASLIIGGAFGIAGENFIADTTQTKLYLVDKYNKSIQINPATFTVFTAHTIQGSIPLTSAIDTGSYSIKLVSALRQAVQGPFHVGKPDLVVTSTINTVKKGGVLNLSIDPVISKYYQISYVKIYYPGSYSNSITVTSVQQSVTAPNSGIDITIPAAFAISSTNYIECYDKNNISLGWWYNDSAPISITD